MPASSAILESKIPRLAARFAIASFLAVAAGCIVARSAGVGSGVWARNAAAWVVGAASAALLSRGRPALLFRAALPLTALLLLVGLFSAGQSGVHRWIVVGPLNWNVAFVLLPAVVVWLAAIGQQGSRWPWLAALTVQVLLCLQPDAAQATSFAAAAMVILAMSQWPGYERFAASLLFGLAAAFGWMRPDPLTPVPEVEGILELARAQSGSMAALCITSLAAVTASPLAARYCVPAMALFAYFLVSSLMPLFGAFPVPLVGMGMSPILGYWLGIGALMTVFDGNRPNRRPPSS